MKHLCRTLQKIRHRMVTPFVQRFGAWRHLANCLLEQKPYIGPLFAANQMYPPRGSWMKRLVGVMAATTDSASPQLLEIGSWAGQSALLWAETMQQHLPSAGFLITCVDPWLQYLAETNLDSPQLRKMSQSFENDAIFRLFRHNVTCSGLGEHIRWIRGDSDSVLPTLEQSSFDVVYVDGSHYYDQVVKDLRQAAPLVKEGGYLCGDDLDLQMDELPRQHVETNLHRDLTRLPGSLYTYHPGVALALHQFFGRRISVYDGFWVVRKVDGCWQDVDLLATKKIAPTERRGVRTPQVAT